MRDHRGLSLQKLTRELALTLYKVEAINLILWCWQAITQTHEYSRYPDQNIYRRTSVTHHTCSSYYCHPYFQPPGFRCPGLTSLKGIITSPPSHSSWEFWNLVTNWFRLLLGPSRGPHYQRSWPNCHELKAWVPALLPRSVSASVNSLHVITGHHQEECDLMWFWQIEDTAITQSESDKSSHQFLTSYTTRHISRQSDGTYCAGFPWKKEHCPLPNNFEVCQKCTRSLAHRLTKSPGLLQLTASP